MLCWFGSCGKLSINLGGGAYDWVSALAIRRADGTEFGKIVISGEFGVARLNADGMLDPTFSGDGINESSPNSGLGVAIRNDGRIVRVGQGGADFSIELYGFSGDLDSKCSLGPITTTDFNGGIDEARDVAIQADGKIVVAGGGEVYDVDDFELARYLGGGCNPKILLKEDVGRVSQVRSPSGQSRSELARRRTGIAHSRNAGGGPIGRVRSERAVRLQELRIRRREPLRAAQPARSGEGIPRGRNVQARAPDVRRRFLGSRRCPRSRHAAGRRPYGTENRNRLLAEP